MLAHIRAGVVSRALFSSRLWTVLALGATVLLAGCNRDDDRGEYGAESRPPEIVQAYGELQSGQPSQAQMTAQGYLDSHERGAYYPEALYISGRAMADQGQYDSGKERLDEAVDHAHDRTLKALAMLARADCNMGLGKFNLASRQYHWIEVNYKDVKALQQDELMFKLGLASKKAGGRDWADYWFNQVNELYNTGPYAERARQENSHFTPPAESREKPLVYSLEAKEYSNPQRAEDDAAMLRSKGYRDVEVVHTTRNSYDVYQVHVGKFNSEAQAVRAQTDARLEGLATTIKPGLVEPMK